MRELTPAEVGAEATGFRLLDVREPWEFEGPLGHIRESDLLPLGQVESTGAAWLAANSEGGIPLLVCRSGKRSADACRLLESLGATDTVNLAGGMIAWNRAGLPTERTEPATPTALLEEILAWLAHVRDGSRETAHASLGALIPALEADGSAPLVDRGTVERVIEAVDARLAERPPADADLCLAAFRGSLETL